MDFKDNPKKDSSGSEYEKTGGFFLVNDRVVDSGATNLPADPDAHLSPEEKATIVRIFLGLGCIKY